jgi:membrane protease YdiL (CAAX protease family)
VSAEFWTETARMAIAGAIVAAVAVPFGLITTAVLLRGRVALLPRWKPWRVPWSGLELTFAFVVIAVIPALLLRSGLQEISAGVFAVPIQLALLFIAWRVLYPSWKPFRRDLAAFKSDELSVERPIPIGRAFARAMTLAILAWALLAPLVLVIHGLLTVAFTLFDLPTEDHPLTRHGGGAAWEQVLFLAQACLAAPLIEEILFRGLLLPWVIGSRERNTGGVEVQPIAPPIVRPLLVMAGAALYAAGSGKIGPVIFAGVLTLGLALLWITVRHGKRHARGVYVSAALFALVHSGVWPTPIPLFFLGIGLGWLAIRTRGVLVPVIVHGLFNAVSAVYVLRGAA